MRCGSPPSRAIASRIAARSTTAGTPVKSWSSTRLVRKAISCSRQLRMSQRAIASMSSALTNASSSFRSRFSSRIFRLNGSRAAVDPGIVARVSRRKIVYVFPSTVSVARLAKEFLKAM
jgi:hypothetical protein